MTARPSFFMQKFSYKGVMNMFQDETLEKIHAETPEHCFLEKSYPLTADNTNLFIISRLNLKTARFTREIFPSLFLVMIIILAICNTILYRFSRKIFTFILNIKNKTKENKDKEVMDVRSCYKLKAKTKWQK